MIRKFFTIITLLAAATGIACAQQSAQQLVDRVIARMDSAPGITASFTLTGDERNALYMQGDLKMKGTKFHLATNSMSTWYDGKTMWSYAESIGEVNVSQPTADELMSINPYYSLHRYKKLFSVSELKSQRSSERRIKFTPTSRSSSLASVVVTIAVNSLAPIAFELTASDGSVTRIAVTGYNDKASLPASTFIFDPALHPGVPVIDLR